MSPLRTYEEGRRCAKCNALLSIYNPNATCWACTRVYIRTRDHKGRARRLLAEEKYLFKGSLCSSRETFGFNKVFFEYHGIMPD